MKKIHLFMLTAVIAVLLSGCTAREMATVNNSLQAEEFFQAWPLSEQYDYYYYGTTLQPIAYLALNRNFTMESKFWTKITPTREMIDHWKSEFDTKILYSMNEFKGKEILSPQSTQIGLVYTRYYWVTAWFAEPNSNQVIIPPPEPSPEQPQRSKQWRDNEN